MARKNRWLWLVPTLCFVLPACQDDKNFCLLGYTTRPNYREDIKTIRVPIFKSNIQIDPIREGMEFQLTRAVIREIEAKTPYKVVNSCTGDAPADSELIGTIVNYTKTVINRNQQNQIREAEQLLAVELVWRDLRTGEILTAPRTLPPPIQSPDLPPPPPPPPAAVLAAADFIPELGQSSTTARQVAINKLAVQIVSMMEIPW